MSVYLVTGGAGFIGSHLCDALGRRGDTVRVLDDLSTGSRDNPPSGVALTRADGADPHAPTRARPSPLSAPSPAAGGPIPVVFASWPRCMATAPRCRSARTP